MYMLCGKSNDVKFNAMFPEESKLSATFWCAHTTTTILQSGEFTLIVNISSLFKETLLCSQIWLVSEDTVALSTANIFSMDCLWGKGRARRGINIPSESQSGEEDPCWEMVNCSKEANAFWKHSMPEIPPYWTLLQKVNLNGGLCGLCSVSTSGRGLTKICFGYLRGSEVI